MAYQRNINLLTAATASAAPASVTDETLGTARPFYCDQAVVTVHNAAGTGSLTATLILWGYNAELDRWFTLGTLNGGSAITPAKTDTISYAEGVSGLRAFTRFYCEISGALGGSGTPSVTVNMVCIRATDTTCN